MTQNDNLSKEKFLELLLKEDTKELGLSDIIQIQEKFKDPLILSVILHQLIEERKKTNKILLQLQEKYDQLQFKVNNSQSKQESENNNTYNIISEVDDKIISFIRKNQKVDATQIQNEFNYKASNAASQRLNRLVKDGYLKKIQAGRKVYFIVR
jgi:predicted HTH transcriptional regulator